MFRANMKSKKRVASEVGPRSRAKIYHTYDLSTKLSIVKVAAALKGEGRTWADIHSFLYQADLDVKKSTLEDWMREYRKTGTLSSMSSNAGRPSLINDDQFSILIGWVMDQAFEGIAVNRRSAQTFIKNHFGIDVTERTVGNYFAEAGLTLQRMTFKSNGLKLSIDEKVDMFADWVQKTRNSNFLKALHAGRIVSSDVTYTGHRLHQVFSYLPMGNGAAMCTQALSKYTNAIYTHIWSDGVNRTPAVLVTHNPEFAWEDDHCTTPAKKERRRKLENALRQYGIHKSRIIFLPSAGKVFPGEKPEYMEEILDKYDWPCDFFLSDGGNGYKRKSKSIIESGGLNHVVFPAAVHQHLSPNDRHLHGRVKGPWRSGNPDWSDDLNSTLHLLYLLDQVHAVEVKKYFVDNFFVGKGKVAPDQVLAHFKEGKKKTDLVFDMCWYKYRKEVLKDATAVDPSKQCIEDTLDGVYWQVK